jgi:hypothetical protein
MFNLLIQGLDDGLKLFKQYSSIVIFTCILTFSVHAPAPHFKVNGMRVDVSYFYKLYPNKPIKEIINEIISNSKKASINTLFIYAFSSVYGAFYQTKYNHAPVEQGYGIHNIFKELTDAAKKNGIRVIAVVPINNFKAAWEQNPNWRAKTKAGLDYVPSPDFYMLSLWHPDFRKWVQGLYEDLLYRNPNVDGIEALEPVVDVNWDRESDYNAIATNKFYEIYPGSKLGDKNWVFFRARGLTEVIAIMNACAFHAKKKSYLVHTWPAKPNGELYTVNEIKKNTGLDLRTILTLTGPSKLNYLVTELIWQQWAAEYGLKNFSPKWPARKAVEVINFVNHRSGVMIHIEPTPFKGPIGLVTPSLKQFSETLSSLRSLNVGTGVYDYNQIVKLNAWSILSKTN